MSYCKKESTKNYYLASNAKQFGAFQKGSYWIVQNDSSLIQDSIYVDFLMRGLDNREADGNVVESDEYLDCHLKSRLDSNLQIKIYILATSELSAHCNYSFLYNHRAKPMWEIFTDYNEAPNGGELTPTPYYGTELINKYGQFNLNNASYYSVSQFKASHSIAVASSGLDIKNVSVYVARNIGLIKWIIQYQDTSSENWSLIRSNIIF
jgi:hypothetical protein